MFLYFGSDDVSKLSIYLVKNVFINEYIFLYNAIFLTISFVCCPLKYSGRADTLSISSVISNTILSIYTRNIHFVVLGILHNVFNKSILY